MHQADGPSREESSILGPVGPRPPPARRRTSSTSTRADARRIDAHARGPGGDARRGVPNPWTPIFRGPVGPLPTNARQRCRASLAPQPWSQARDRRFSAPGSGIVLAPGLPEGATLEHSSTSSSSAELTTAARAPGRHPAFRGGFASLPGRAPDSAGTSDTSNVLLLCGAPRIHVAVPTPDECTFARRGQSWTTAYGGHRLAPAPWGGSVLPRPAAAASRPHIPLHRAGGNRLGRCRCGRCNPGLGARATGEYQRILAELDEAVRWNDAGRLARAHAEREFLLVRGAATCRGPHGRYTAERARVSVTKAIGLVLARIGAVNRAPGDHLSVTVRRGYRCRYTPDPRRPIMWTGWTART
jgi:hypothetical protein